MKTLLWFVSFFSLIAVLPVNAELNLELPDLNLPDLGAQSRSYAGTLKEQHSGLKILRKLRRSNKIIEDPELSVWIRSIGHKLASNAPRSSSSFFFVIAKNPSINAFATPGGVVVINSGLILHSKTESELAAVIAHEIAHVTQNHIARMISKSKSNQLAAGAAVLAGVLASSKDPQAGQAIISASMAGMAHQQLSFSREAEAEADRVGLRILARAGFNPVGMPNFLNRLEQFADNRSANMTEYLRSHPLTLKRVSDTRIRAKQFGNYRGRENISYLYMREKLRALTNARTPIPANLPANIKKYSRALQLKQRGNYQAALRLTGNSSHNLSEAILIAQLLNKQRKYQQTIRILEPLIKIYPGDEVLSIPLAQAYVAKGQALKGWKVLNEVNISEQTSLEYFEALQETARLARKNSQAYRAVANRNIRTGNYKAAALQLRRAIKQTDASEHELLDLQKQLTLLKAFTSK